MKQIQKPIEVVTVFYKNGLIKPKRFRLIDEDQQQKVFKVEKILKIIELGFEKQRRFTCVITINEEHTTCELTYFIETCKWMLTAIDKN